MMIASLTSVIQLSLTSRHETDEVRMNDISRIFLYVFEILSFWAVSGVKGQKIAQNEK